jgi:transcription elongation factor Elf1
MTHPDPGEDDRHEERDVTFELPCQSCGCHAVFAATRKAGDPGQILRCRACGRERTDLSLFYGTDLNPA